jgi:hypothetical protein
MISMVCTLANCTMLSLERIRVGAAAIVNYELLLPDWRDIFKKSLYNFLKV